MKNIKQLISNLVVYSSQKIVIYPCGKICGEIGKMPNSIQGVLFALIAAALNASIGIFSKVLLENGLNIQDIAFLKTITAFSLLSIFIYRRALHTQKKEILVVEKNIPTWIILLQIALCAFLGIFVLFFFETKAYQ